MILIGLFCIFAILNDAFLFGVAFVLLRISAEMVLNPHKDIRLQLTVSDKSDAREKSRRLKEAVVVNRLYEDAELTLSSLAVKLGIHPHELSRIINTGLDKNFSDFINEFRVREVSRKMRDPAYDHLTLLGIAYESGFNSKTTFNRVFREITGKTPLEYKKEVPIDKLAPRAAMRPVILRSETPKRKFMIRNYLKIAYRQLLRQKMYATVKIGGFALGIAACLLIGLYIHNEMTFDRFYPGADRIFRVVGDGEMSRGLAWPAPMSKAIQQDFPEVEFAGRMRLVNSYLGHAELRRADQRQNTYERGIIYIDQSFFSAFKLPMVYGDGATALKEPQTMVISKTMADKYYRGQNPVGRVMYIDNDQSHPYRIGGVMADIPANSHLNPFHFFITLSGMEFGAGEQNSWRWFNYIQYIKLKAGTNVAAFEEKLNTGLRKNYWMPEASKGGAQDPKTEAAKFHVYLQAVPDINLHSAEFSDGLTNGDIRFVWLFGAIALFILVIACINFINLSTAKSAGRAKEVGLRKVVGSYRSSLIAQFLTESLIYSFISFILGIMVAWLLLPYFNSIAAKSLTMPWLEWWFVPVILLSTLVVGTLAGLYPAFYLSGFSPGQVLKGTISTGSKSPVLRNGLVVFQFAASIILIISTVVIYNQMHFILNRKVGFDKDQVMVLQGTNTLGNQNIKNFKAELGKIAAVKSASISDYLPINGTARNGNAFFKEGREKIDPPVLGQIWQVDDTYLATLGIKLIEGRNFSYGMADDTAGRSIIINENMIKKLGLKNPVGARIYDDGIYTVIGVVQDFNFESMRGEMSPLVLHFGLSTAIMTVKLRGGEVQNAIAIVSALWKKYSPNQPIRYTFLDEEFANMYADVTRTGKIFTSFAVLAIIIACLGLFALSAFMAEQRSKEIGIRKVLGASVQGITTLLSVDFIKLVLLAILIASPVAWWAMYKWLQNFAYRVTISWWMFAIAGLGAILIALITVSFQSIKAALANPVKSLRSE
ncbi:ABC transporter permease [Mucilaginibacter sp. BJC16-A38]|uniref:ABC transporter permease n=1 Tax=Mucilaginibacter phenanthrenivorans TaxID=1234842 RepID=UPI0021571CF5|nr:ABC transporter permease [Mucilaginibacter phenanthrenivorans]MCR8559398.1 ABC transporter permease [Mucilaginibacter phenanthrenivorans]